jgi:hypothetical protein
MTKADQLSTARANLDAINRAYLDTTGQAAAAEQSNAQILCPLPLDPGRACLDALLAEYSSLRQESLNTITNRNTLLAYGLVAIGAVVGGALTSSSVSDNPLVIAAVFSIAIPLLTCFTLLVWLIEATRSRRAGFYLASTVEPRINALVRNLALTFEGALWSGLMPRDEMLGPSMMSLAVFGLIGAGAPVLGLAIRGELDLNPHTLPWDFYIGYLLLALAVLYGMLQLKRLRNDPQPQSPLLQRASSEERSE